MPDKPAELIRANLFAVFGERDRETRQRAIAEIWSADGIFIDPDGVHTGPAELDLAVDGLLAKFPGFVFTELGAVDAHNGIARLAWGFGPPGAPPSVTGLDVIVTASGKISALYTFLDPA